MAGPGREETTRQPPPVDQPTDESPALNFEPEPQVVDTTAVEEPAESEPPPVRAAEEEVAPTGGPEPSFEPSPDRGPSPREAQQAATDGESRPELAVLGAFAGGLVLAQILKRLGGGGDE
jgi:hypothetical protein